MVPTAVVPEVVVAGPVPGRSRKKLIGAVAGVGALLAASTFAVVSVLGNDSAGGASSPEAVGRQLFEAVGNEDVLGMIDLLLPGERETFREPVIDLFDNLRRIEVLDSSASLDRFGGIDYQFSDLEVTTEPTAADDIVRVVVDGAVSFSVDGDKVPLGNLLVDEVFDGERPDMTMDELNDEIGGTTLAAVERDGRWYLSLFYSIAENARGDRELPAEGLQATGADSPEQAVDQLLSALEAQDVEALIASLDPTEAEALQRYAPLFLDDAQQGLSDAGIEWSITDRAYSVEGSGSRRHVDIDSFTFQASSTEDESSVAIAFVDGCATIEIDGESVDTCADGSGEVGSVLGDIGLTDDGSGQEFSDALQRAVEGYSPRGIAVHEVDGEWYVSLLRTGFDFYNDFLGALDKQEIVDIIDAASNLTLAIDPFGLDESMGLDDSTVLDGDLGVITDPDTEALDACYAKAEATEALACLQGGLADGSIDPMLVPATLRHPECGVAELYWSAIYSMSDADFTSMATAASPCFLDLIARGELDSFEVPYELVAPQCLEGINWYLSSDTEFSNRFFNCAEAVRVGL